MKQLVVAATCLVSGLFLGGAALAQDPSDVEEFNAAYTAYLGFAGAGENYAAIDELEKALDVAPRIYPDGSAEIAGLRYLYGRELHSVGRSADAIEVIQDALAALESSLGKGAADLSPILVTLGDASLKAGKSASAVRRTYDRALNLVKDTSGDDSVEYGRTQMNIGTGYLAAEYYEESQRHLDRAYTILRDRLGPEAPDTGLAAFQLGRLMLGWRRYAPAAEYLEAALRSFEDAERPSNQGEIMVHAWLVSAYENLDRSEEATRHCLAIGRMTPYDGNRDYQPLYREAPDYPRSMLLANREGHVDVSFTVDANGFVRDPEVIDLEGDDGFVAAALEAVAGFRYAPRFVDGSAVATNEVKTRISFRIRE